MSDGFGVVLEDINDKLQGIAEAVGSVQDDVRDIKQRLAHVESLGEDTPTIKTAVTNHSHQMTSLETRITNLEAA